MSNAEIFITTLAEEKVHSKDYIILGTGILDGQAVSGAQIKIPLKTLNRHGLIAGSTGTGKTKTLQVIAEQLSLKGIPSVLMDLKGDLSGLAKSGTTNDFIQKRSAVIGVDYTPMGLPFELKSISQEKGVKLKATVSEFGPMLISQILDLNDTQSGVIALNEKGISTPLAHTLVRAPITRMDILEKYEIMELITTSKLVSRYNQAMDRESAFEMLEKKMIQVEAEQQKAFLPNLSLP